MRAIIHSIHSQVPETVSELGQRFDAIVSMDSHLDVSLGGDDSIYPGDLRIIAGRTGAHSALRHITGGLSALKDHKDVRILDDPMSPINTEVQDFGWSN